MRRLRHKKTPGRRVARSTTVHLRPGTPCFDVTAHPVGSKPKRVGKAGLELRDVDRLRCPHCGVDYVGHTVTGDLWVAFDMAKVRVM